LRILVVNNNTSYLPQIRQNLVGHDIDVIEYMPGVELNSRDKDLVILTGGGGEGREANDRHKDGDLWYKYELQFILDNKKPLLGICMGFELISQAYGSPIEELPRKIIGFKEMRLRRRGSNIKKTIKQFKYHNFRVSGISSKHFEAKAVSRSGIEIIQHKTKPILATQFHPELGGEYKLHQLVRQVARSSH